MPEENEDSLVSAKGDEGEEFSGTLYALAMDAIKDCISIYLELADQTKNFNALSVEHLKTEKEMVVVLGGIGSSLDHRSTSRQDILKEWEQTRAVPFDVESAITKGVYLLLRERTSQLLTELEEATAGFVRFTPDYIRENPRMLPILQRLANISSKAELKKRIGSVSDNVVSSRAAEKLAEILNFGQPGNTFHRSEILRSIEPTLEGIVRDLVGRVLLESIVAKALDDASVPYKRESEYAHLEGVLYNFRADFVLPDDKSPKAFIEVRKSSSRHASLYAKDKMFSAINWKGKNQELLAVLVVDGPWTAETLKVMTKLFDYVVPLNAVADVAGAISAYLNGDKSRLKWLVQFSVKPANGSERRVPN
jgi:hypothetical protein